MEKELASILTKQIDINNIIIKMEADLKKLKIDFQISKNKENDLRDQIISFMSSKLNISLNIMDDFVNMNLNYSKNRFTW